MNKTDLKKIIKPLVKECIHEVLLEEGLLSNVVSEVAKGMQSSLIVETRTEQRSPPSPPVAERQAPRRKTSETNAKINQHRRRLMDSIGTDAYNGVNLFEGTQPMSEAASGSPKAGSVDLGDAGDAGVDISSLMGGVGKIWQAMK